MIRPDLRRIFNLVSPDYAIRTLKRKLKPKKLGSERIPISDSVGRVLAVEVKSPTPVPPCDNAIFDGYALNSRETVSASRGKPVSLKIAGSLFPQDISGDVPELSVGEACYVATGAPVPRGADAVIKVENTELRGKRIEVSCRVEEGENVSRKGSEIKEGESALKQGVVIRPQDQALLVALGLREVDVVRRPKISILSVGDEMHDYRETSSPMKTVNNYALMVSSLLGDLNCEVDRLEIVKDSVMEIKDALGKSLQDSDMILTIAGVSVGKKDLVPEAIQLLDPEGLVFHGVYVKPGHVAGAAVVEQKPIIMLPGHVVSAVVSLYLFAVPLLALMSGIKPENYLPRIKVSLGEDVEPSDIYRFLRVSVERRGKVYLGRLVSGGSNVLNTLTDSNGFHVMPPNHRCKAGDELSITLYSLRELSHISQIPMGE